jgi:tRNA A37 threonylcarbamoyladenosine modification protein TsaB
MILYIDTTDNNKMILALFRKEKENYILQKKKNIPALRRQAEKLLPSIEKLLGDFSLMIKDIEMIVVNNYGGSFTSLRIGVVTANALAYALKSEIRSGRLEEKKLIVDKKTEKKFSSYFIIEAMYSSEPNIGKSKK